MIGRTHLLAFWNDLRSTFWFVPSIMAVLAVSLAALLITIDHSTMDDSRWMGWIYGGGADGARALLSAVAGSTITVVSLTFSMTVVALTVSSQHFGPRLLVNFMRDTTTQVVLGVFIGTFAFCVIVLRTVQGEGEAYEQFVPHLSVTMAVALSLISVAALIYYLHHVAASMQVSEIALRITRDLEAAIDRLYPQDEEGAAEDPVAPLPAEPADGFDVRSSSSGYVQAVDLDAVLALAEEHDTTVWLRSRPGDFVVEGAKLARAWPVPADSDAFAGSLRRAYVLGADRTSGQDAEFAVQQLVEVALHALSPGMNEPFTALTCIDRLGQGLNRLLMRRVPSGLRTDDAQRIRVVAEPRSFESLLAAAFDPLVLYAGPNTAIYQRLLETLAVLALRARGARERAAITAQAFRIRNAARAGMPGHEPRGVVEALFEQVLHSARALP